MFILSFTLTLFTLSRIVFPTSAAPLFGIPSFSSLGSFGSPSSPSLPSSSKQQSPTQCKDVTVVFARGTLEQGLLGSVVGPPFENALQSALGHKTLSFQGVDYPADIPGFFEGGSPQGVQTMTAMITSIASRCTHTQIVMSGYSQGAQLVHKSSFLLSPTVASRVTAVVIFGDPDLNQLLGNGLSAKSQTFCAKGDDICESGGFIINNAHLSYGKNAGEASEFVMSRL